MAGIVVIGSCNTDMIVQVPRIPKPGETIIGGTFSTAAGGKGANQAVAAARAGGQVTLVACVGKDSFGEQAVEGFLGDDINVDYITRSSAAPSGVAMIFVSEDGENSIAVAPGANDHLTPELIDDARPAIVEADMLVLQLEVPLESVARAIAVAKESSVPVILNPAPARACPDEVLQNVTYLTPNEFETEMLTGLAVNSAETAARAADILRAKGIPNVLITMGSRGVYVSAESFTGVVPALPVNAVDTTAAGDVFNGALAVALAEKKELFDAVRFATAAAALSVTRLGAQTSVPIREDIERFLRDAE